MMTSIESCFFGEGEMDFFFLDFYFSVLIFLGSGDCDFGGDLEVSFYLLTFTVFNCLMSDLFLDFFVYFENLRSGFKSLFLNDIIGDFSDLAEIELALLEFNRI